MVYAGIFALMTSEFDCDKQSTGSPRGLDNTERSSSEAKKKKKVKITCHIKVESSGGG